MAQTALVFGGTGLVGSHLLQVLAKRKDCCKIISFVRKQGNISSPLIEEIVIDFDNLDSVAPKFKGDIVFICLGTTIKKAGSVENMEKINRDLPIKIGKLCQDQGVKKIVVVSSIGADEHSRNYYLRIKGEMEHGIRNLDFENIIMVRPSMLLGKRNEPRLLESVGKVLIKIFGFILIGNLRKYRGIHASTVAKAILYILDQDLQEVIYESDELEEFGNL